MHCATVAPAPGRSQVAKRSQPAVVRARLSGSLLFAPNVTGRHPANIPTRNKGNVSAQAWAGFVRPVASSAVIAT